VEVSIKVQFLYIYGMDKENSLTLLFVVNPRSGKNKVDYKAAIEGYFKNLSHRIHFFMLDEKVDENSLRKSIEEITPDRVIAVGGDGTITLVAKQLLGTGTPMGIIPAGSANGMAKELNIPMAVNEALNITLQGEVKSSDVIDVNNQICLHLSDIGLNAQLVKYFEQGNMRGKLGYARFVLKVLWRKQFMHVVIQSKDKEIRRDALMVVLANASKYGTGAVINPEGSLYDGLFEVVIIRRLAISEIFKMWVKPQPFNRKKIEVFHARSVQIETSRKVPFQVDGEYLGKVKRVVATILPSRLKLILPIEK
jgi:diacylglycerol kinase (ATP)